MIRRFFGSTVKNVPVFVPQNLLRWSEQFSNAVWLKTSEPRLVITSDTTLAPDGTMTADTFQINDPFHGIQQRANVVQNTLYTFSFYCLLGTVGDLKYSIRNESTPSDIIPPTSYFSLLNASTFTRVSFEFTTPSGCSLVGVFPSRDGGSTGSVYIWGAQLNEGPLRPYSKTEAAIIP